MRNQNDSYVALISKAHTKFKLVYHNTIENLQYYALSLLKTML